MCSSVLQSSSRMITSCETSTSRRVRYPESAVRSAVSARPLRAPCVEMKYSSTDRPSMKLDLIGRSMISPFGFAMRPRIPASWRICLNDPRAPELAIMYTGFSSSRLRFIASPTSSVALFQSDTTCSWRSSSVMRPRSYERCALPTCSSYPVRICSLSGGIWMSFFEIVTPDAGRVAEAELLDRVEHLGDRRRTAAVDQLRDELGHVALRERAVLVRVVRRLPLLADGLLERPRDLVVEDRAADRRHDPVAALANA